MWWANFAKLLQKSKVALKLETLFSKYFCLQKRAKAYSALKEEIMKQLDSKNFWSPLPLRHQKLLGMKKKRFSKKETMEQVEECSKFKVLSLKDCLYKGDRDYKAWLVSNWAFLFWAWTCVQLNRPGYSWVWIYIWYGDFHCGLLRCYCWRQGACPVTDGG